MATAMCSAVSEPAQNSKLLSDAMRNPIPYFSRRPGFVGAKLVNSYLRPEAELADAPYSALSGPLRS